MMAKSSRFDSAPPFNILQTYKSVFQKSTEAPNQLIVVIFNIEFPDRGTIEPRLKNWRCIYEKENVQFFKCIIVKGEQDIKTEFKIEDTPTFLFFYNGSEVDQSRIDDLDEANPNIPAEPLTTEESKDEKKLKEKINDLCKKFNLTSEK